MEGQLPRDILKKGVRLSCKNVKAHLIEYGEHGLVKVCIEELDEDKLPPLYDRGIWRLEESGVCDEADLKNAIYSENSLEFLGEIRERYIEENQYMLDIHMLDGLYKSDKKGMMDFIKSIEAIIITSASEKMVVNIFKLNPNHAFIESQMELPKNEKVWLRYKELAIACFPKLEHNDGEKFSYELDFSTETLEKRGKLAELILRDKL